MGKNKNHKRNSNIKKKEEAKEDRLDPTLPGVGKENDCVGSTRSDAAPLLSSSGETTTVAVQGTEGTQNIEMPRDAVHRDYPEWRDVQQWWDGQCTPLRRMVEEETTRTQSPAQAFIKSFERLQLFHGEEFLSLKAKIAEAARERGAKPLPSRDEKVVEPASLPDRKQGNLFHGEEFLSLKAKIAETARERRAKPLPSRDEKVVEPASLPDRKQGNNSGKKLNEFIATWKKVQDQYLASGMFNNLQVRHYSSAATEALAHERAQELVAAQQASEADAAKAKEEAAEQAREAAAAKEKEAAAAKEKEAAAAKEKEAAAAKAREAAAQHAREAAAAKAREAAAAKAREAAAAKEKEAAVAAAQREIGAAAAKAWQAAMANVRGKPTAEAIEVAAAKANEAAMQKALELDAKLTREAAKASGPVAAPSNAPARVSASDFWKVKENKGEDDGDWMKIDVCYNGEAVLIVPFTPLTPMSKLLESKQMREAVIEWIIKMDGVAPPKGIVFRYQSSYSTTMRVLVATDTPQSLGMDDGDEIHVECIA